MVSIVTEKRTSVSKKKVQSIYLFLTALSVVVVAVLAFFAIKVLLDNQALRSQEAAIYEEYDNLSNEHENLVDGDYSDIYYDGGDILVPSDDVIIEHND